MSQHRKILKAQRQNLYTLISHLKQRLNNPDNSKNRRVKLQTKTSETPRAQHLQDLYIKPRIQEKREPIELAKQKRAEALPIEEQKRAASRKSRRVLLDDALEPRAITPSLVDDDGKEPESDVPVKAHTNVLASYRQAMHALSPAIKELTDPSILEELARIMATGAAELRNKAGLLRSQSQQSLFDF